jgi:hypothetical protein
MPNTKCQSSNEARAKPNFKTQIIALDFGIVEFGFDHYQKGWSRKKSKIRHFGKSRSPEPIEIIPRGAGLSQE